ncbi:MAG: AAA family ATPase [Dehalococcoidia bacterium]
MITAAVIDNDPRRRERVATTLDRLAAVVLVNAPLGIVGSQAIYETEPTVAFVSFEEPFARSIQAVAHASVVARVIAYSSHSSVDIYRAAIRSGAHVVLDSPPRDADLERALAEASPHPSPAPGGSPGNILTVASAKGGTGKSTLASTLAMLLATEHASTVLLIDFALEFGDAELLLDIADGNTTARAARQVARSEIEEFRESLGHHESGVFVLGASRRFDGRLNTDISELEGLLDLASRTFDHVIIDTASVFDDRLLLAADLADLLLIPATPDVVTLANTRRFLHSLEGEGLFAVGQVPLLIGTAPSSSVAPVDAAEILERPALWEVPFDPRLPRGMHAAVGRKGRRGSPALRSLAALASRIANEPANVERRTAVRPVRQRIDTAPADRLRSYFGLLDVEPEEVIDAVAGNETSLVYSRAASARVYHQSVCTLAARISAANRTTATTPAGVPTALRPCRVCTPASLAA